MSEENNNNNDQPATEPQATEPQVDNNAVRNSPLFQKVASQLKQMQEAIAQKESAEQQAKEEAERKQLEAKGEYETLLSQLNDKLQNTETKYQRELTQRDLKFALANAGMSNQLALDGAIAGFNGTSEDVQDYVAKLKEDHKELFTSGAPRQKMSALPTQNPATRGASNTSWKQVYDSWVPGSRDPKSLEAESRIQQYLNEYGEMPPRE
jgi:hypothetical protein